MGAFCLLSCFSTRRCSNNWKRRARNGQDLEPSGTASVPSVPSSTPAVTKGSSPPLPPTQSIQEKIPSSAETPPHTPAIASESSPFATLSVSTTVSPTAVGNRTTLASRTCGRGAAGSTRESSLDSNQRSIDGEDKSGPSLSLNFSNAQVVTSEEFPDILSYR